MTQKKKRKPFSLYERNGFFYVRLWDEAAGKYTSAKTTGENKRDQAVIKVHEMVKAGQVKPREQDPYFIDLLSVYWTDRNDLSPKYKSEVLKKIETVVKPSKHLKNVRMSEIDARHLSRLKNAISENIKLTYLETIPGIDYLFPMALSYGDKYLLYPGLEHINTPIKLINITDDGSNEVTIYNLN